MTKQTSTIDIVEQSLKKRYRSEKFFKAFGMISIGIGVLALVLLFTNIIAKGIGAFQQTYIQLEVHFDEALLEISSDDLNDKEAMLSGDYAAIVKKALRERFPDAKTRGEKRELYSMISVGAEYTLCDILYEKPELFNKSVNLWVVADDDVDTYYKTLRDGDAFTARFSENQQSWITSLQKNDQIKTKFNTILFTEADSAEPEQAGILGALLGSLFTMMVTLILSFPIGVAAAVYLEEYAPKNKFTDFIEININNLAAVPSVIFGLLGLAIFLNMFNMPRSVPLVGGLVLTLMTLPTIIISSRSCLKAVPPSIREAALGMGASRMQMILHHVVPLAMPGMLTGAILGMAQALGETAPLLMIGMVAFISDLPGGVTDPATVLPVQIFLWADSPERAFVEKTSAAIMVLLAFMILMNGLAVWLRKKLERRW